MVTVHEGFEDRALWPFQCLSCRHTWEAEYVRRSSGDGHGHEVDLWLWRGVPVHPPWVDPRCPGCDGMRVAAFPPGYLGSHPDLLAPFPVATPAAVPAVVPAVVPAAVSEAAEQVAEGLAGAVRAPGGYGRLLLVAVMAVALLALAGWEFYEITHHVH